MTSDEAAADDWYEREVPTRIAMVGELQRLVRRARVRPLPVILLAAVLTAGVTYRVATKPHVYTADFVLAIDQGSMSFTNDTSIPFDQLQQYVASVLLPENKLLELVERRSPGRIKKVGTAFALESLRDHFEVRIWKNSFVYFHAWDANAQKSARIGIEAIDEDPDDAFELARELADLVIRTHDEKRRELTTGLAREVADMRRTMQRRADDLAKAVSVKQAAMVRARQNGNQALAAALYVDLLALASQQKRVDDTLGQIMASPDAVADRIAEAGFDTSISVVDKVRPEKIEQSGMVLAMLIAVIGVGSLIGSILVLGAFDARVHEVDDISRLGLPVLGHLPGFPGDQVGSLEARGAARRRVPSLLRWRSHR